MIARHTRTVATSVGILWALSFVFAVVAQQGQPSTGLYHADPQHLWNRLHRHLHVRTATDGREFGLDEVDALLWDETRHLLTGPSHTRALDLLDEFLNTDGERLITDSLKRAVLQHDLWAIFDWAVEPRPSDRAARERAALSTRLARVIRRVALTRDQIERLPGTYAGAVRSDRSLPPDLVSSSGDWLPVGGLAPIARRHAEGLSRSAFSVYWSVPGGTAATAAYLRQLWEFPAPFVLDASVAGELRAALNPALPPVPNGTRLALIRTMLLIDESGAIVATELVESIQLRTVDPVHTAFAERKMQRAGLFAGQGGGLRVVEPTDRSFITFSSKGDDLFEQGRAVSGEVTLNGCENCHNSRYRPAVGSVLSIRALLKPESLVDMRNPRWVKWYPTSMAAVEAKAARVDWGLLRGIWQSVPR